MFAKNCHLKELSLIKEKRGRLSNLPKISIVTPVYNGVQFIEACILSVLRQNYPNLEYIVIDGGSTDGTVDVIKKFAVRISYFVSERDRGQTHALNKGFERASGDIYAWLNADEEYLQGTLMEVGEAFKADPTLDFYYGNRIIIDRNGEEIGRKRWVPMHPKWHLLYRMDVLPTDASFWSARVHKITGTLDEKSFPRLSMDADWLLRLSMNVKKWKRSSNYLSRFTEHPDQVTVHGLSLNPTILRDNGYFARVRVIKTYGYSTLRVFFGWIIAGIWCRFYEKRISLPHILSSFNQMFFKE